MQKWTVVLCEAHLHPVHLFYQMFFYVSKELVMEKFELSMMSESKCLYSD